ncbi:MAG: hypothetical protein RR800_00390 [Comamonas sp.]
MEIVQERTTTRFPAPELAPIQKPLNISVEFWNAERSCYHRLDENVRESHKATIQLFHDLRENLEKLKFLLRVQATPGNAGQFHAIPNKPTNKNLVSWHLDRANNTWLVDGSREWHYRTWKELIAIECATGQAIAQIYTKELQS